MEAAKDQIRAFLRRYIREVELGDDENIFTGGFVNSLFVMQLILFLENEFGIKIENQDLQIKNFSTVNEIEGLVMRKRSGT